MYKINPVKATCMKYKGKCELADINDTCYSICAAYGNSNNVYEMNEECAKTCAKFIEQKKIDLYGVGSCDHQAPYRPVIWGQTPRYFPKLIEKMSPIPALHECKKRCESTSLPNQCKDNCELDYNALENFADYERPNYNPSPTSQVSLKKLQKHHPILFGAGILAMLILIILIIWFIKTGFVKP